jgi:hypothetical protein
MIGIAFSGISINIKRFLRKGILKNKKPTSIACEFILFLSAEEEGFEPPDLLQSTVFKTAAIDRSAIPPRQKYKTKCI